LNYIAEINSFERWLETNYLPAPSQLLWYKLLMLCNRAGWAEWVTVDNLRLMGLIQAGSVNTFLRARDALIDCGLVDYQKGRKGSPNRYKMRSVSSSKIDVNTQPKSGNSSINELQTKPYPEPQTELKAEPYPEPQTEHIYKQNKTKQNETKDKKGGRKGATKSAGNNYEQIINEFTDDPELKTAIWDFIQMRTMKKRPPTDRALQLVLKRLEQTSLVLTEQIAILEQSTVNSWTDIYPLKKTDNHNQGHGEVVKNRNVFVDMLKEERDIYDA